MRMSLLPILSVFRQTKLLVTPLQYAVTKCGYAAPGAALGKTKKMKKSLAGPGKVVLPVETDTNKLVNYVCGSNIYKEGEDIKLKPESEYPDWLWTLWTENPPALEDLDPNTKAYWRKLRKMGLRRNNIKSLHKQKKTSYRI
ncbi:39S ribosomal protein L54, mitochondrial [Diachasma alloeum]|uniref:39S ribosomal protein L54, mitochondrial n=1 Tax=Diachasma alloeum TaxID=454923 RepID=UPI0007384AE4|nr:39S ribosomal protein L54, mitochondrial [Diachasma alloeum]